MSSEDRETVYEVVDAPIVSGTSEQVDECARHLTDRANVPASLAQRVDAILQRRVHRIHRMQAAGLLTEYQADALLDELDTPGSEAWEEHERYRQFVAERLRERGGMA